MKVLYSILIVFGEFQKSGVQSKNQRKPQCE
jgi:hypothetical protein